MKIIGLSKPFVANAPMKKGEKKIFNSPLRALCNMGLNIGLSYLHRLRPIDTHLALYTMLYNSSAKN